MPAALLTAEPANIEMAADDPADDRCVTVKGATRGSLLIVDADVSAAKLLARAMTVRGFDVRIASTVAAGLDAIETAAPDCALVDLRLGNESGLNVVVALSLARPAARIVIFSFYGGLAHTVAAVKAGAADHLPKPASLDAIEAALLSRDPVLPSPINQPMRPERVRWEHIQTVLRQAGGNLSEAGRRLRMHRRTLQRILAKGEPRR